LLYAHLVDLRLVPRPTRVLKGCSRCLAAIVQKDELIGVNLELGLSASRVRERDALPATPLIKDPLGGGVLKDSPIVGRHEHVDARIGLKSSRKGNLHLELLPEQAVGARPL